MTAKYMDPVLRTREFRDCTSKMPRQKLSSKLGKIPLYGK